MSERIERFSVPLERDGSTCSTEVVVRDSGAGDVTVLCLHGFGDNLHTWQQVRSRLEPLGARVIAVDLPGLGRSPLPAGFARSYLDHAIALTGEMAARWRVDERPFFLMGNSLGGSVALGFAASLADRSRALDGLLLLAPATLTTKIPVFANLTRSPLYRWSGEVQRRMSARTRRALGILVARASFQLVLSPGARAPAEWRESIVEAFSRPGCFDDIERIARHVLWILRGESSAMTALHATLPRISTPTRILHGDADRVISRREVSELATMLPNASLTTLDGVGHCPQIEAPDRCAEAYAALVSRLA